MEEGGRVVCTAGVEFEREKHTKMFPHQSRRNEGNVAIVICVFIKIVLRKMD